jgi:serine/threonine-protein kinase
MTAPAPNLASLQESLGNEFEIQSKLGAGKTSTVYLALEKGLDRLVALKLLSPQWAADKTARGRFEREAKAAASLSHSNIVQVFRQGRIDGEIPYLAMQYVEGRNMEERLAGEGPLEPELARKVLSSVAAALAAAHAKGIVHRDVRPPNVLWDKSNEVAMLSDFGIAALVSPTGEEVESLTLTGELLGDPRYVSPEQATDAEIGPHSDIYSLGVLGYELLTGDSPYDTKTPMQALSAHLTGTPRDLQSMRPEVGKDIADVLRRCLNRNPKHRPRAEDLVRILEGRGSPEPSEPTTFGELSKRRLPQAWAVTLPVIVAGISIVGTHVDVENTDRWPYRVAVATGIWVFALVTTVSWFHGEKGEQKAPPAEFGLLGACTIAWLASLFFIFS